MKTIISIFIMLAACSAIHAQDIKNEYKPILTDGKMWKVLVDYGGEKGFITYTVIGDTIVNGKQCKKIKCSENPYCLETDIIAHEEDKKLYCSSSNSFKSLMLDFGLNKGDAAFYDMDGNPTTMVSDVDYITTKGITRKRITITTPGNSPIYWVEGIGTNIEQWIGQYEYPVSLSLSFYECYENGKLIFSLSDFNPTTTINKIQNTQPNDIRYSITGERLKNAGKNDIYIQNGKKRIVR